MRAMIGASRAHMGTLLNGGAVCCCDQLALSLNHLSGLRLHQHLARRLALDDPKGKRKLKAFDDESRKPRPTSSLTLSAGLIVTEFKPVWYRLWTRCLRKLRDVQSEDPRVLARAICEAGLSYALLHFEFTCVVFRMHVLMTSQAFPPDHTATVCPHWRMRVP